MLKIPKITFFKKSYLVKENNYFLLKYYMFSHTIIFKFN
jgi:hypothetical protein